MPIRRKSSSLNCDRAPHAGLQVPNLQAGKVGYCSQAIAPR